jgi:hypothetical protein
MSTTEELLGRKRSGSGLENRDYGPRDPSRYSQESASTSPTSVGRSVGKVLLLTQATELVCLFVSYWMLCKTENIFPLPGIEQRLLGCPAGSVVNISTYLHPKVLHLDNEVDVLLFNGAVSIEAHV